jgi:hypothetical protein
MPIVIAALICRRNDDSGVWSLHRLQWRAVLILLRRLMGVVDITLHALNEVDGDGD